MTEETTLNKIFYTLLGLMAVGLFAISYDVGFYYDDVQQIIQNPAIRNLFDFNAILNDPFRPGRVFTNISLTLNWTISKANPWSYHLFNVLFHTLNTGLLFVFLKRIGVTNTLLRMFSGWLFFCHPLMVEGVSYVMGRTELLKTLVTMVLLLLYLRTPRPKFLIYVILIFSLLVKETCGLIPFLFIALDLTVGRLKWRELPVREHLFYLSHGLWMLLWWQFLDFEGMHGNLVGFNLYPFWDYALTNLAYLCFTLKLILVPTNTSIIHEWPLEIPWVMTIAGGILLVLCLTFALRKRHQHPLEAFWIVFFFVSYLPNSSVLQFINPYSEYRLYQTVMPFSFGLALLIFIACKRTKLALSIATIVLVFYMCLHVLYVKLWHGPVDVWLNAQELYPHSIQVNTVLSHEYKSYGFCRSALKYMQLGCQRNNQEPLLDLHCAVAQGLLQFRLKDFEQGRQSFLAIRRLLPLAPQKLVAKRGMVFSPTNMLSMYTMLLSMAHQLNDQVAYQELLAEARQRKIPGMETFDVTTLPKAEACRAEDVSQ